MINPSEIIASRLFVPSKTMTMGEREFNIRSNLRLRSGNCVATAYDVNDKGIPDAARRAIEFQYAEVVKQ